MKESGLARLVSDRHAFCQFTIFAGVFRRA